MRKPDSGAVKNAAKTAERSKKERIEQMICEKCGQWIEGDSKTCSKCGAPIGVNSAQDANAAAGGTGNAAPNGGQPGGFNAGAVQPAAGMYGMNAAPMTKDQFYKHPNIAPVRSQIRGAGILCYVVAGISLVASVLMYGFWGIFNVMFDVLLVVGLGLGIQLGKSRACAIVLTVYGVFNMIIMTISRGTLSGWWILLAGIYAIINTFKYQGAWEEYLKTGIVKDFTVGKGKK